MGGDFIRSSSKAWVIFRRDATSGSIGSTFVLPLAASRRTHDFDATREITSAAHGAADHSGLSDPSATMALRTGAVERRRTCSASCRRTPETPATFI
jgi:hypothetical protein